MDNILLTILLIPLCLVLTETGPKYKKNVYLSGFDLKEIEEQYREQDQRVERPCPLYDLLCIRRYLARHSKCKIADGPIPDPLYRTQSDTYYPTFNISVTQHQITLRGLNGAVSEFTVNRKSQLTVIKIDFTNVTLSAKKLYFRFHRRGLEPAVTTTSLDEEFFPSFSITTVFKGVDHLQLFNSESVVSLNELATMLVGPDGGEHPDPTVGPRYAAFLSNPYVLQQEGFLTVAPFYAAAFIQNVLCDFGLKKN